MTSKTPLILPGLGNLDQTNSGGGSVNTTTKTTAKTTANDGNLNEKSGSVAFSAETKSDPSQAPCPMSSSTFDQRPPGTSTYFSPPILPPPTGNARPSFGITANAGDLSARSSLSGFSQFATKAGANSLYGGETLKSPRSAPNLSGGVFSASSLPSAAVPSQPLHQSSLPSKGLVNEGADIFPSVKPTDSSTNTPAQVTSVEKSTTRETNADGTSIATQKISPFDPASRQQWNQGSSFSNAMIYTRHDSSSGDDRAHTKPIPSTNDSSRAMSVGNNTAQETTAGGGSIATQNASSSDPALCKPREPESALSTSVVHSGHDNTNGDNCANFVPIPFTDAATPAMSVGSKPQESESTLSTSMVRTEYDNPGRVNRANFGPILSTSPGQYVPTHPNSSVFISPGDSKLGSIDISKISPDAATFCFGVLATQANFAPRFEYTYGGGGLWGIKLTFWGHTIVKQEFADGKLAAKAAICRKALEALKPQFNEWMMPDLPAKCSTSTAWNWPHVLEKHCFQVGFDTPGYTKYLNGDGFRFEVEIAEASYFGMLKCYRSEGEAKNASAHLGLYSILVNNLAETSIFPGASFLRAGFANNWDEHESRVSRARMLETQNKANLGDSISSNGVVAGEQNIMSKDMNNAQDSTSTTSPSGQRKRQSKRPGSRKRRRIRQRLSLPSESFPPLPTATGSAVDASNGNKKQKIEGSMGDPVSKRNPNPYCSIGNCPTEESHPRLSAFAASAGDKRWDVSAKRLKWQTRNCATQKERVAMICGLLALQDPEYNLDLHNRGFGAPEHHAAAYFPNDPFLARAGAVGQIRYTHGERLRAGEECAKEVANYLIGIVERDLGEHDTGRDVHIKIEQSL